MQYIRVIQCILNMNRCTMSWKRFTFQWLSPSHSLAPCIPVHPRHSFYRPLHFRLNIRTKEREKQIKRTKRTHILERMVLIKSSAIEFPLSRFFYIMKSIEPAQREKRINARTNGMERRKNAKKRNGGKCIVNLRRSWCTQNGSYCVSVYTHNDFWSVWCVRKKRSNQNRKM